MKNLLSGSIDEEILDLIKDSLARLAMEIDAGKVFYYLKSPDEGFDYHWFFDAKTKQLERFDKGITVEVVEAYDNEKYNKDDLTSLFSIYLDLNINHIKEKPFEGFERK